MVSCFIRCFWWGMTMRPYRTPHAGPACGKIFLGADYSLARCNCAGSPVHRTSLFSPKLVSLMTATLLPSIAFSNVVPSADVVGLGQPSAGARRVRPAAEAWLSRHSAASMQAVRSIIFDAGG